MRVQLSYEFVGCSDARNASTATAERLVISYRYGRRGHPG